MYTFSFSSKVLKIDFCHDPLIATLGWAPFLEKYTLNQIQIVQYGMTTAKHIIVLMWNKEFAPKFETSLTELSNVLHVEKNRNEIVGKPKRFVQIWKSFFEYLESDP